MALSSTTLLADQEVAKTSLRLPKSLMKRMKLYAIESEKSVTEIVIEACNEYLQRESIRLGNAMIFYELINNQFHI